MPSLQSLKSLRPSQLFAHGRSEQDLTDEDFRLLRATGTIEYLAGAFTLTAVYVLPDPDTSDHGGQRERSGEVLDRARGPQQTKVFVGQILRRATAREELGGEEEFQ